MSDLKETKYQFTKVPIDFVHSELYSSLSGNVIKVWLFLYSLSKNGDREVIQTIDGLAKSNRLSRTVVINAIKVLEEKSLIKTLHVGRKGKTASQYLMGRVGVEGTLAHDTMLAMNRQRDEAKNPAKEEAPAVKPSLTPIPREEAKTLDDYSLFLRIADMSGTSVEIDKDDFDAIGSSANDITEASFWRSVIYWIATNPERYFKDYDVENWIRMPQRLMYDLQKRFYDILIEGLYQKYGKERVFSLVQKMHAEGELSKVEHDAFKASPDSFARDYLEGVPWDLTEEVIRGFMFNVRHRVMERAVQTLEVVNGN